MQMSLMDTTLESEQTNGSIWIAKKENASQVDKKKLEKAEAKIKMKQEKKSDDPITKPKPTNNAHDEASASQQFNRKDTKFDESGINRSGDIKIDNFDIAFGEKVLITGASIQLICGRRYGLIGRNGLGKTTLLKMIAKKHLRIPSHLSILHVEQEVAGDDTIALDSVLSCDEKRESLLKEEKMIAAQMSSSPQGSESNAPGRLSEIYQELEAIEADKAPARAGVVLAGMCNFIRKLIVWLVF